MTKEEKIFSLNSFTIEIHSLWLWHMSHMAEPDVSMLKNVFCAKFLAAF
jgi:hypothetical protein